MVNHPNRNSRMMNKKLQDELRKVLEYLYEEQNHFHGDPVKTHIWLSIHVLWEWLLGVPEDLEVYEPKAARIIAAFDAKLNR